MFCCLLRRLLEAKGPAATFFTRQFWQCFKMLRSMLLWQGIISDAALMEMSLDALLNRYIMLALQNSPGPLNDDTLRRAGMVSRVGSCYVYNLNLVWLRCGNVDSCFD